jgi:hypothetical protein
MDTLVVSSIDKMPIGFQRKFLPVPESNMIIAGTGSAGFINGWFGYVSTYLNQADIDDLDLCAPDVLRNSAEDLGEITTTMYHFGYSEREIRYIGYAYRSTANFKSERLQYALGFKPEVSINPSENIQFPNFLIEIVLDQQRYDRMLPIDKQVGIGGEIEFAELIGGKLKVETVHRFSSYENEHAYIERKRHA